MEKLEYIDGLVSIKDKKILCVVLENIMDDLRDEGFYDEDIYGYINNVCLKVLHKKYDGIIDKLK